MCNRDYDPSRLQSPADTVNLVCDAQAALGGGVGNLQRIRAFLRIRLRDYGVLDFDAGDARRQPPVDTTWQQDLGGAILVMYGVLACILVELCTVSPFDDGKGVWTIATADFEES